MKKFWFVFVSVAWIMSLAACKKKDEAGKSATAVKESANQIAASLEKEFGEKPKIHIAVNVASVKSSPLYALLKDKIEKKIEKKIGNSECAKNVLDTMESAMLLGSPEGFGKKAKDETKTDKNNENVYIVLKGADVKATLTCIKESKKDMKDAKLNGVDVLAFEIGGQTGYLWKGSDKTVVFAAGTWAQKITPGKGVAGKGEIASMTGSKSIVFSASDIDDIKETTGTVDLAKGLMVNVSVTMQKEDMAQKAEKEFQNAKKEADQIPIPGLSDIVKSIQFSRNGANISVQVTVSSDQLKQLLDMAKGMGGLPM